MGKRKRERVIETGGKRGEGVEGRKLREGEGKVKEKRKWGRRNVERELGERAEREREWRRARRRERERGRKRVPVQ